MVVLREQVLTWVMGLRLAPHWNAASSCYLASTPLELTSIFSSYCAWLETRSSNRYYILALLEHWKQAYLLLVLIDNSSATAI